jgi:hypothetical protein
LDDLAVDLDPRTLGDVGDRIDVDGRFVRLVL